MSEASPTTEVDALEPAPAAAGGEPARGGIPWSAILFVGALLPYLALVWSTSYLIDDAFISFRYAKNWAEGNGLRFNLGVEPPVEGFSNFLWVCALTLMRLAAIPLEVGSRVLSVGCGVVTLALVHRALLVRVGAARVPAFLATLFLATFAPFTFWSTGGLETTAYGLALLGTVLLLTAEPAPRTTVLAALCGLVTSLLRVEGLAWILVALVIAAVGHLGRGTDRRALLRSDALFVAVVLSGYAALLVARHAYFGEWVANTVHAKAVLTEASLLRGLKYVGTYVVVVPSALLATILVTPNLFRLREPLVFTASWLVGGFLVYDVIVGGDWMPMFRFLAPSAPLLALATGAFLSRRTLATAVGLGLLLLALNPLPALDLFIAPRALREALYFRDFRAGYQTEAERIEVARENTWKGTNIGRAMKRVAPPETTIVAGAIGAHGYYSELFVYDRNGLVNREVAHLPATGTGSAGHDKRVPRAFFLEYEPTWLRFAIANAIPKTKRATQFRRILRGFGASVFQDPLSPGDDVLRDHCVARIIPLERMEGLPEEASLIVLEYTRDTQAARAFWRDLGL